PILKMVAGMIPAKILVPGMPKKFDIRFDSLDVPVGVTDPAGRTNVWWSFKEGEADVWDGISSSASISFYGSDSPILRDRSATVFIEGRKTFAYPASPKSKTWTEAYTAIAGDEVDAPTFRWMINDLAGKPLKNAQISSNG